MLAVIVSWEDFLDLADAAFGANGVKSISYHLEECTYLYLSLLASAMFMPDKVRLSAPTIVASALEDVPIVTESVTFRNPPIPDSPLVSSLLSGADLGPFIIGAFTTSGVITLLSFFSPIWFLLFDSINLTFLTYHVFI